MSILIPVVDGESLADQVKWYENALARVPPDGDCATEEDRAQEGDHTLSEAVRTLESDIEHVYKPSNDFLRQAWNDTFERAEKAEARMRELETEREKLLALVQQHKAGVTTASEIIARLYVQFDLGEGFTSAGPMKKWVMTNTDKIATADIRAELGCDDVCPFCDETTDSLAANPGKWPVVLTLPDGTGKPLRFHRDCVHERLYFRTPQHDEQLVQWRAEGKIR